MNKYLFIENENVSIRTDLISYCNILKISDKPEKYDVHIHAYSTDRSEFIYATTDTYEEAKLKFDELMNYLQS